jgi:hypothetical protein
MDDNELEARLRTHLHGRFDDAPVPRGLADTVHQGLTTATRPVGYSMRPRRGQLGWAVGLAASFVVVALLVINPRNPLTPGGSSYPSAGVPSPDPNATDAPDRRTFVVLPPVEGDAGRALINKVNDQLALRAIALGAKEVGSFTDAFIVYTMTLDGQSNVDIKDVLMAPGDIQWVPLPLSDYANGKLEATPGQPLPKDEPPLFGWEGIESSSWRGDLSQPNAIVTLNPAAADTFAAYTTNNVGSQFAIVVDGLVGIALQVNVPITDGQVELASGLGGPALFRRTVAIMNAGKLADGWKSPVVVEVLSEVDAIRAAKYAHPSGAVTSSALAVITQAGFPRVVWRVNFTVNAVFPDELVTIDAVTGQPIR